MNLKSQLIDFEGVVAHAYKDSEGFLTIGVGRLIDKRKGGGLSPGEIDFLLDNDIARVRRQVLGVLPWLSTLNEPRQAVLLGMAFQMGVDGLLGFKNTLACVKEGQYDKAAKGMLKSKWAKQTPERVKWLAEQMLTGEWTPTTKEGSIPPTKAFS